MSKVFGVISILFFGYYVGGEAALSLVMFIWSYDLNIKEKDGKEWLNEI